MKGEVQIYRNIHRNLTDGGQVFSIRNSDGIVKAYESYIALMDCKLRVSPKGNQRVRDEGRKNVHAYIQGKLGSSLKPQDTVEITYNPKKHKTFVRKDTGEAVHYAKEIFTTPYQVFAVL